MYYDQRPQLIYDILDVFEDYLDGKGVVIDNEDKRLAIADGEDPAGLAILYGCEYGDLLYEVEAALMEMYDFATRQELYEWFTLPAEDRFARAIFNHARLMQSTMRIVEVLEDYLDEKGITIETEEKKQAIEDGEEVNTIYGYDCIALQNEINDLLINAGLVKEVE